MAVLTPLAQLTAVLENEPVMGIDWTKLAAMLHTPRANISCDASTGLPLADDMQHYYVYQRSNVNIFTKSFGNRYTLQYGNERNDDDGRPQLRHHFSKLSGGGVDGDGEWRRFEVREPGLDVAGQGEHALAGLGVQDHGQHQAEDHNYCIPIILHPSNYE